MALEISRLKALLRALALYVEARGRLLQIEAQEAGSKLTGLLVVAALLCGCLLSGWLLALPAVVWLIAEAKQWPWPYVALGIAAIHLFLAFLFTLALLTRLRRLKVFEETFHQLQRDREWLSATPPPN